jgi:hypothetical protein
VIAQSGDEFFRENHLDHFGIFQHAKVAYLVALHQCIAVAANFH